MAKAATRGAFDDHLKAKKRVLEDDLPLIVVTGACELLVDQTIAAARQRAKSQGLSIMAMEAAQLTEASFEMMLAQASLFEPATLYIIRRSEQARSLAKLLKAVPKGATLANRLVFVQGEGKPGDAVATELRRLGAHFVPCQMPWPEEIPRVVRALAKELGVTLDDDALALLLEVSGLDLVKHRHELTKLALLHGDKPLSRAAIAPDLGLLREDDAFLLDRLLLERQWAKAQALVTALLARGEKATGILWILISHCRNALRIKDALRSGEPFGRLGQLVRLPPSLLKLYAQMAPRLDLGRYHEALVLCGVVETELKSQGAGELMLVSRILATLAGANT